jgi:ribose transport system substrate-binding protein
MSEYIVPAIQATHAGNRVHIDTFNGTPFVLKYVQQKTVQMDVGIDISWIAREILDGEMRIIAHRPFIPNERVPLYICTKANIARAGNPPQLGVGYGNSDVAGYNYEWGLRAKP